MSRLRVPESTYRVQFNGDFTFVDALETVPYFAALGVSHLYASPFLKARSGSTHGYDIVDHTILNPEIGDEDDFTRLHQRLRDNGMGQILDLVPNHMGVGGADNHWWLDVLEYGQSSPYANFFDIDWQPVKEELRNKVLLPVLDDQYGEVLERGGLKLAFDAERGEFSVWFFDHRFPIDPGTYHQILECVDGVSETLSQIASAARDLPRPQQGTAEQAQQRRSDGAALKSRLADWYRADPAAQRTMQDLLQRFNGVAGEPDSFLSLHRLLEQQAYRLAWWRVASDEINYRRFFDINELAGLSMELPEVFDATHWLVAALLASGRLDGLRIDHPDGLRDPAAYFRMLRERLHTDNGDAFYLVVEKILASYERLPADWPVQGTTGYEFMYLTGNLLVDGNGQAALTRIYHRFIGRTIDYAELLYERKKLIIRNQLSSELTVLANLADGLAQSDRRSRDFTLNGLRDALIEVVACFPVYRTYVAAGHASEEDRRYVHWALAQARKRSQARELRIYDFLERLLLLDGVEQRSDSYRREAQRFAARFQQYTSPIMAKAMEDTTFYIYNRLLALNEVGGDPHSFGISTAAFHRANRERLEQWPHAMLASSTHDAKRSEDVRARLAVLSELPLEWRQHLRRWGQLNRAKAVQLENTRAPSRNDEYMIYQNLLGVWPLAELDEQGVETLRTRMEEYLVKAMREAKVYTSWINPSEEYERATLRFLQALLRNPHKSAFLADFLPFQRRVARFGLYNSLAALTWKFTAPGVPDLYQGNELWTFDLVDPDNRRPVDYALRARLLEELRQTPDEALPSLLRTLAIRPEDPRTKLFLTWRLLQLRRRMPALFQHGDYVPVAAEGDAAAHLCVYERRLEGQYVAVVTALHWSRLLAGTDDAGFDRCWGDTRVPLAADAVRWRNVLNETPVNCEPGGTPAALLFRDFPVAVLHGVAE